MWKSIDSFIKSIDFDFKVTLDKICLNAMITEI